MEEQRRREQRQQRDLPPPSPQPLPARTNSGAPKWIWLIPIAASSLGFLWAVWGYATSDELVRGAVALTRMQGAMAESVIFYILVSAIDRMTRQN